MGGQRKGNIHPEDQKDYSGKRKRKRIAVIVFSPLSHRYLNIWEGRRQHVPTSLNTPCWRCVEALLIVHDLLGPMSWMDER